MRWFGFRDAHYHRVARSLLAPRRGERIVVVGGGTGVDVVPIADAVADGTVWNVDVSTGMLARCEVACDEAGVDVHHVHADAADWDWPRADGVLCSFTLLFQPRFAEVLAKARDALGPGGRLVFCDLDMPPGLRFLAWPLVHRFGHTATTLGRHPARLLRAHWHVSHDRAFYAGLGRMIVARP